MNKYEWMTQNENSVFKMAYRAGCCVSVLVIACA